VFCEIGEVCTARTSLCPGPYQVCVASVGLAEYALSDAATRSEMVTPPDPTFGLTAPVAYRLPEMLAVWLGLAVLRFAAPTLAHTQRPAPPSTYLPVYPASRPPRRERTFTFNAGSDGFGGCTSNRVRPVDAVSVYVQLEHSLLQDAPGAAVVLGATSHTRCRSPLSTPLSTASGFARS
jgi:hypothetical protein